MKIEEIGSGSHQIALKYSDKVTSAVIDVKNILNSKSKMFPNPLKSGDLLHIDLGIPTKNTTVRLYNMIGSLLLTKKQGQSFSIAMTLRPGIYIMCVINTDKLSDEHKIIVY